MLDKASIDLNMIKNLPRTRAMLEFSIEFGRCMSYDSSEISLLVPTMGVRHCTDPKMIRKLSRTRAMFGLSKESGRCMSYNYSNCALLVLTVDYI